MPEDYFGERIAERYDEDAADMFDPAVVRPAVDFLADLAGDGAALELGIGTGRIALPLVERGVRVHGIDLSEAMVARLRAKPGAEEIGVTVGDFATTRVAETNARLMEMRGRQMRGWLRVDAGDVQSERELAKWVELGATYARSLPPKS